VVGVEEPVKSIYTIALLFLLCAPAIAEDRDDEIFGEGTDEETSEELVLAEDPLELGGILYLRFDGAFVESANLADHDFSSPNFADLYLDARPNDRLRGFIRGRLKWNPTVEPNEPTFLGLGAPPTQTDILLNELWLKFDVGRTLFVTLGKAHVRWGASRLWNPIDLINTTRRSPLAFFDERTGLPLLKLHFPIESLGWNFYLLGVLDEADPLGAAAAAARAEFVFSTVELGLTGAYRRGEDPKAGLDLSAGIFDLDFTGEVGFRFEEATPTIQASAGLEYGIPILDDDSLYLGAEYFYNQDGHDTVEDAFFASAGVSTLEDLTLGVADGSIDLNQTLSTLQFFYIGEHYAAVFFALPYPGSWNNTSFTLSTVANLSDYSALSRLDISTRVLTYLTVQTYIMGHWGNQGELRAGPEAFSAFSSDGIDEIHTQLLEVGIHLRLDL